MSPARKATINGHVVAEYYWAGEMVTYLDNRLVTGRTFDAVVDSLSASPSLPEGGGE